MERNAVCYLEIRGILELLDSAPEVTIGVLFACSPLTLAS